MKPSPIKIPVILLGLSLLINIGLLAALVATRPAETPSTPATPQSSGTSPASTEVADATMTTARVAAQRPAANQSAPGVWSQLHTDDLVEMIRQLKAAGFSPAAIRSIVYGLIDERFEPRRRELISKTQDLPYWKAPVQGQNDPKKRQQLNELAEEQSALTRKLLGPEYWLDEETNPGALQRRYGNLPQEKITALQALISDYQEMMEAEMRQRRGSPGADEQKKLVMLLKEQHADMARLLSPAELFEYELRNSEEASRLLSDTKAFQPTEAEFRALFPLYQAAGDSIRKQIAASPTPADFGTLQSTATEQIQAKIKDLLGPDRYADYVQAKDPASDKLNRIVQRLELPLSAATAVVAVQKDVTQRADAVKADRSLTADQRQAQLAALAQEAATKITGTLGTRGFGAYQQYSGRWLQALQTKVQPGKP